MTNGTPPAGPQASAQDPYQPPGGWQADLVEQRRQGREQELWSIPAISIAAQAFLFTTGLAPDTKPAARIILGAVGLLTALGTLLAVLRQAARVYIAEQWMDEVQNAQSVWCLREQLLEQRRKRGVPETSSVLERLPQWILGPEGRRQISTGHIWTVLLIAFSVADVLVILSAISGIQLLTLGS